MPSLMERFAPALALIAILSSPVWAQTSKAKDTKAGKKEPAKKAGGFVPGQERPPEDPKLVARGNKIYGVSCRGCHGADLRGGDMGGPNLLRSQLALSDRAGEKIVPVIQGSLQSGGMPAIPMSPEDANATAAYVRSIMATIGGQGKPPSSQEPPTILVGNADEGKAYFSVKCASCHSATGDLQGIATKIPDPKILQNTWVAGARRAARGGPPTGGGAPPPPPPAESDRKKVTVKVTPAGGGEVVEGRLLRLDDFVVTLELADGSSKSFRRDGDSPKVDVNDPLAAHRNLFPVYTDGNIHDVTAYLVTLK
jgi:cytochrome c oxidase cbb3-type subunit 3